MGQPFRVVVSIKLNRNFKSRSFSFLAFHFHFSPLPFGHDIISQRKAQAGNFCAVSSDFRKTCMMPAEAKMRTANSMEPCFKMGSKIGFSRRCYRLFWPIFLQKSRQFQSATLPIRARFSPGHTPAIRIIKTATGTCPSFKSALDS